MVYQNPIERTGSVKALLRVCLRRLQIDLGRRGGGFDLHVCSGDFLLPTDFGLGKRILPGDLCLGFGRLQRGLVSLRLRLLLPGGLLLDVLAELLDDMQQFFELFRKMFCGAFLQRIPGKHLEMLLDVLRHCLQEQQDIVLRSALLQRTGRFVGSRKSHLNVDGMVLGICYQHRTAGA